MNTDPLLRLLGGLREYLPLIIFLVVVPISLYLSYRSRQKQIRDLKALAGKLGLNFRQAEDWGAFTEAYRERLGAMKSGDRVRAEAAARRVKRSGFLQSLMSMMQPLAVHGKYSGYQVELSLVRRNKKNLTEIRASYPEPLGLGLSVARQGFLHRSLSFSKEERAESGNAELDKLAAIRAMDALKARYIARRVQSQQALLALFRHKGAEVTDLGATVMQNGHQTDYGRMKAVLDDMTRAMQAVAEAVGHRQGPAEHQ